MKTIALTVILSLAALSVSAGEITPVQKAASPVQKATVVQKADVVQKGQKVARRTPVRSLLKGLRRCRGC